MELQELVVRVVASQMRFRLAPRFADVRGDVIAALKEMTGAVEYGWSDTQTLVFDSDHARNFVAGSRELRLVFERVERMDDYIELGRQFFSYGLEKLGVESVEFVGVRSAWMGATESFEDLSKWMSERLNPTEPFTQAVGQGHSDVGWTYEYRDHDPKVGIRMGPMKIEQFLTQYVETTERDFYPEVFLFMDLDRIIDAEPIAASEAVMRWEDSITKSLDLGQRIGGALYEGT
jgi:hypothetical protein